MANYSQPSFGDGEVHHHQNFITVKKKIYLALFTSCAKYRQQTP